MEEVCVIKVIGVGGCGLHAVRHMIAAQLPGVTFIVAGADVQALLWSRCETTIQLGGSRFQGCSPGLNRQLGREAAKESLAAIKAALAGADLVFVVAGMGGRTGSGAAPVIAQAARELGALTIGVVTAPFTSEGRRRLAAAEDGLTALCRVADCLVLIPNSQIQRAAAGLNLEGLMRESDKTLHGAVLVISDLLARQSLLRLDLAAVQAALCRAGLAATAIARRSD